MFYFACVSTASPDTQTDIYSASWDGSTLDVPVAVAGEINTAYSEVAPVVAPNALTIYFASDRTDGTSHGNYDIWMATRARPTDPFSAPSNVADVNSPYLDLPTFITGDGCDLYLSSTRNQVLSAWVATKRTQ